MYGSLAGPLTLKLKRVHGIGCIAIATAPLARARIDWAAHVTSARLVNRKAVVMETSPMEIVRDRSMSRRHVVALSSAALAVGALSVAGVPIPARAQSPVPDPVDGDFAGLIDIGGRSLYLTCTGSGGPTVVLVTGYRDTSDIWSIDQINLTDPRTMVMPSVAEFTRVCAYDRPGTATALGDEDLIGRSDAIPQPRTATEAADELHALVHAAGIETPFVLAAHSLGGAIARLYASAYPEDVSGLVLIEAYSEFIEALMTPEQWQALVAFNQGLGSDTVIPLPGYGDLETIPYGSMNQELRRYRSAGRSAAGGPVAWRPVRDRYGARGVHLCRGAGGLPYGRE